MSPRHETVVHTVTRQNEMLTETSSQEKMIMMHVLAPVLSRQ